MGGLFGGPRGRCPKRRWTVCGCVFRVTSGPRGIPSVLPRGPLTMPEASLDCRPAPGCEQEGPPPASFLRISVICASLWFGLTVEKKREGRKRMVFVTCPKLTEEEKVGVRCAGWMLCGPGMRRLAQGVEPGTPGTLTGLWGPGFCGGDVNGLSGGALVVLQ